MRGHWNGEETSEEKGMTTNQEHSKIDQVIGEVGDTVKFKPTGSIGNKRNGGAMGEVKPKAHEYKAGEKALIILQVNCRSIYNKALELCNLVNMYNPDVVIGTESWLTEEISNTEIFRADCTTFRRDRHTRGGGVFTCVKNDITCSELWVDDIFEITAVEVKGNDPKDKWEIVGVYRAPNEDFKVIERLAE